MLVAEGPQIGRAARPTKSKYTAENKSDRKQAGTLARAQPLGPESAGEFTESRPGRSRGLSLWALINLTESRPGRSRGLSLWARNLQGIFFLSFAAFCQL